MKTVTNIILMTNPSVPSTPTLLDQFDPNDPESCKKLFLYFFEVFKNKAESLIVRKSNDLKEKSMIETFEIMDVAFKSFINYIRNHPEHFPKNRIEVENSFAINIGFAIRDAIRQYKKTIAPKTCYAKKDKEFNPVVEQTAYAYWEQEAALCNALSLLSSEEYRKGSGLSPMTLCHRYFFLNDTIRSLAKTFDFDEKTISRYLRNVLVQLRKLMDLSQEKFSQLGTAAKITSVRDSATDFFQAGDYILRIEDKMVYNDVSLELNVQHIVKNLSNAHMKGNESESITVLIQRFQAEGNMGLKLLIPCQIFAEIMRNLTCLTAEL